MSIPKRFFIPTEDDLAFEDDLLRNPGSFKAWWRYLSFHVESEPEKRFMLYERAVKELPGSYKLWFNYVTERKASLNGLPVSHPDYEDLNNVFERSLSFMHKYPRIWIEYLNFLVLQRKITKTRQSFDRALKALPVTQHERIWPLYVKFIKGAGVSETAIRVFRRYLKFEPEQIEEYIDYLLEVDQPGEAARLLANVVDDETFISQKNKSRHDLWLSLCDIASKNPTKVQLNVEAVIRSALAKFTNEVGKLWVSLANYFIKLGNFEKARDIFEEGITSAVTQHDFSHIWDAYTEFEYGLISARMEEVARLEEEGSPPSAEEQDMDDLRMARYEDLLSRQQVLISDVALRQNPHNVNEWHKRISLFEEEPRLMIGEFTNALRTVNPQKALGKPHSLWIRFAKFWEDRDQLDSARKVLEKAAQENYKKTEWLAAVWCEAVEMELRHGEFQKARQLVQQACSPPPNYKAMLKAAKVSAGSIELTAQQQLFKQTRVWGLYADLEESLGTFATTKAVYDKIIELKIATPQLILNFANYLEEHNYFEESFKVYERGVDLFKFPYSLDIWVTYLTKFVERYGGSKLERARDLFEQAVEGVPPQYAKILFLMYAELEEKFGLARHAMQVYDRATRSVTDEEKPKMFNIYLQKATKFFGVTRTREIFDRATETLPEKYSRGFCFRYAQLERKLGEIDRARAIYTYCSQMCDPKIEVKFWETWREFEMQHGNKDTFREMLRIKRSVAAQYSVGVNVNLAALEKMKEAAKAKARPGVGAAPAAGSKPASTSTANAEEINLDEEDGEEEEADGMEIAEKAIPAAVYGSVLDEEPKGAKERLKKAKPT